ncbi:hypothetical protein niasHT_036900 [Heterodera trifolii]|uniref:Uncharacterized protein n=1 Tax=Heterodera trifolii TaxID=157864 RepID=A0ABD2IJ60_9BILA
MNSFILFTIPLLFFIVHLTCGNPDQNAPSFLSTWFPMNPYGDQHIQSAGYDYSNQSAGGYNYGQSSGYHQQPPPSSYGYAPDQPYSYGYSQQPISHGNFGRSYSDVHPYNHNQPPPGNYGRSQSDVHQPTSYSNDIDEEAQRPAAGSNKGFEERAKCYTTCKKVRTKKNCEKIDEMIGTTRCKCQWESSETWYKRGECYILDAVTNMGRL